MRGQEAFAANCSRCHEGVCPEGPPLVGPLFIERWREGYDIVYGVRSARETDTVAKRVSASWFYWAFNSMSPVRIPANVGDFRLVDRRAIEVLRRLPERNRYMKGLFAWIGYSQQTLEFDRPARAAGASTNPLSIAVPGGRNGPIVLRGDIEVLNDAGEVILRDTRVALCRCGPSAKRPFCDGTHRTCGFRASETAAPPSA